MVLFKSGVNDTIQTKAQFTFHYGPIQIKEIREFGYNGS